MWAYPEDPGRGNRTAEKNDAKNAAKEKSNLEDAKVDKKAAL